MRLAVEGNTKSGVVVAQISRSTSLGAVPVVFAKEVPQLAPDRHPIDAPQGRAAGETPPFEVVELLVCDLGQAVASGVPPGLAEGEPLPLGPLQLLGHESLEHAVDEISALARLDPQVRLGWDTHLDTEQF